MSAADTKEGDVLISRNGKLVRPKRLASGLFEFRKGTGHERCVFDCISAINAGADLLWIETAIPTVYEIKAMMDDVRKVHPNAKLVYNNSPSFNWTLSFRKQSVRQLESRRQRRICLATTN